MSSIREASLIQCRHSVAGLVIVDTDTVTVNVAVPSR